jgi:hypothetical protein
VLSIGSGPTKPTADQAADRSRAVGCLSDDLGRIVRIYRVREYLAIAPAAEDDPPVKARLRERLGGPV